MRRLLSAAALAALLLAAGQAAAAPPGLLHGPEGPVPGRTLLLVLEEGPDGVAVLGARVADVRAKVRVRPATIESDGLLLALTDATGDVLVLVEAEVLRTLHGPFVGEDGEMHCRAVPDDGPVVISAKVPFVPDAERLVIVAEDGGPSRAAADVVRDLRADPAAAGLRVVGGGRLADLLAARGGAP